MKNKDKQSVGAKQYWPRVGRQKESDEYTERKARPYPIKEQVQLPMGAMQYRLQ